MLGQLLMMACGIWGTGWGPVVPHFDLVEINHKMAEDGSECFVQILAWTWAPDYSRFHCEGFRLVETWRRTQRGVRFLPSDNSRQWQEVNGQIRETWTIHDPEIENRRLYPIHCRLWSSN